MNYFPLVLIASLVFKKTNAFKFSDHDKHPNATDCMSDGPWDEQERSYPSEELLLPEAPVFRVINDTHLEVTIQLDTRGLSACYLAETGKGYPLLAESQDYFVEKKSDSIKLKAKINPNKDHTLFIIAVSTTNDHKYSGSFFYTSTKASFTTSRIFYIIAGSISGATILPIAFIMAICCTRKRKKEEKDQAREDFNALYGTYYNNEPEYITVTDRNEQYGQCVENNDHTIVTDFNGEYDHSDLPED